MKPLLDMALWAALAASVAATIYCGIVFAELRRDARDLARIESGEDFAVAGTASGPVLVARAKLLGARDRLDEAQALLDAARDAPDETRAQLHYIVASARLRQAVSQIERGEIDKGVAQVGLAKTDLRETLRIRPSWWDAKQNLDVAMRLVRDFPQGEGSVEEPPEDAPKRLWTDVPGAPRGLP